MAQTRNISTAPVAAVLAASATPVAVYGGSGATPAVVAEFALAAGSVAPSSMLEFSGLCNFYTPNNAGRSVVIKIGGVTVGQAFPTASMGGFHFIHRLWVGPNAKALYTFSANINDVSAPTAGQGAPFSVRSGTKTSYTVDLTVDQTVQITLQPINGDTAELVGWSAVNYRSALVPTRSFAPASATVWYGDSLSAGTGATTVGGAPTLLRVNAAGRPVTNNGIGGETAQQIVDRLVADKVAAKFWNLVLWIGRNNVGDANLTSIVQAQIARAVAHRGGTQKLILLTVTPASNEPNSGALGQAIAACNAQTIATYGNRVIDLSTVIPTNADGTFTAPHYSDTVHFTEAAYVLIEAAVRAKLAALGM